MKKLLIFCFLFSTWASAQQTAIYTDQAARLKQAKEYYSAEQFSLAFPIFKQLQNEIREQDYSQRQLEVQDIQYYAIVCALQMNQSAADDEAKSFIELTNNAPRVQMMSFHLAEYYFKHELFDDALRMYENAGIDNLSNKQVANMQFHQGYCYFLRNDFDKAKPLFNSIRQIKDDPNYIDANYYYGFICFNDKQYGDALKSFQIVENEPHYKNVIPFFIAEIYYFRKEKDKALEYAEAKLKQGGMYYDMQMRQLVGHTYFEKQDFDKALPYLEAYVGNSEKVRREDLYEVSYCYYKKGNFAKCIPGFKQLSGSGDSLSQHSMYLLGDAYLKTNDKANARSAFGFCSANSSFSNLREVSKFNYAKLSYELGFNDVAITEFKEFLNEFGGSKYEPEARETLVQVLANTNNYTDALDMLESMPNPSENVKKVMPRIWYGRAMELVNDGQFDVADNMLTKASKAPYNAGVLPYINFWKGELAMRRESFDEAIVFLNDYLKAPLSNGEVNVQNARYNLGYCHLRKENYKQALGMFELVTKNANTSSSNIEQDAFLRSADCYFMAKDFGKAKNMYENIVNQNLVGADYAYYQKSIITGTTNANEKVRLLKEMAQKYPTSTLIADANMEMANTYLSVEKFGDAIPFLKNVTAYKSAISLHPQAYLKLGIAHYNMNNNNEALVNYKTLIQKFPNSTEAEDAMDNIKTIYVEMGKPDEYVAFMKQNGKEVSYTEEDSITYTAANLQLSNGNKEAGLTGLNAYLTRFPEGRFNVQANYQTAELYNAKKDFANAVTRYNTVGVKAPNKYAEKSMLMAARIYFFEQKDFAKAEASFIQLKQYASNQENKLEAMRGLLRCQYNQKKWADATTNAQELLKEKTASTDDKVLCNMVLAKNAQLAGDCAGAITAYKNIITLNKAGFAAEARYEIANCLFTQNKLPETEKAAFEVINKSGSYDFWVTKAYILLGDVYFKQKDYFNAKATWQSVFDNATNAELKAESKTKLDAVIEAEKKDSKVG
jgi:tetratricopeptide (TPR) repeat protein